MFPNYPPFPNQPGYNPNYGAQIPPNQNMYGYPPQGPYPYPDPNQMMMNPPQISDKRKTYTPNQFQGKMVFQGPELIPYTQMPNQPQQNKQYPNKKIGVSHGYQYQNQKNNQIPGHHQPHPQQNPKKMNINNTYVQQNHPHSNKQQKVPNQPQPQNTQIQNQNQKTNYKKTPTLMTVNTLANLPYSEYGQAEYSHKPFYNICAYAFNSYNGKVRNYNEDTTKTVVNYPKKIIVNGKTISPRISYFAVFDGHGGKACSAFLRDKLDSFLFNSRYFPGYPIQAVKEAFAIAEQEFMNQAIDKNRNALVDKSGSCALVALIINDILYAINLGDSRALFSTGSGANLYQITRDHKPNDSIERRRIEKSGAKVYYANKINIEGKEVTLKESDYGEGFKFPYRIMPGGISVSIFLFLYL